MRNRNQELLEGGIGRERKGGEVECIRGMRIGERGKGDSEEDRGGT